MMVAASIANGSSLNTPVKYKLTTTIKIEDKTPAIGVLAPASALTTVRERLPVTGNEALTPALIFANPSAISSWLLLSLLRCWNAVACAIEIDSTKLTIVIIAAPGNS